MLDFVERMTGNRAIANYVLIVILIVGIVFIALMYKQSGSSITQPSTDLINAEQPYN